MRRRSGLRGVVLALLVLPVALAQAQLAVAGPPGSKTAATRQPAEGGLDKAKGTAGTSRPGGLPRPSAKLRPGGGSEAATARQGTPGQKSGWSKPGRSKPRSKPGKSHKPGRSLKRGRIHKPGRDSRRRGHAPRSRKAFMGRGVAAAEPGTISIEKAAIPHSSDDFAFKGDLGPFTLKDETALRFMDLDPGTYRVTEIASEGWVLEDISCEGPGAGTFAQEGRTIVIELRAGAEVSCSFLNQSAGSLEGEREGNGDDESPDQGGVGVGSAGGGRGGGGRDERAGAGAMPSTGLPIGWLVGLAGLMIALGGSLRLREEHRRA